MNSSFPAKLILFGEYAIVLGAEALAIPFNKYSGKFIKTTIEDIAEKNSNKALHFFYEYLNNTGFEEVLDLNRFNEDIQKGICFKSNIPVGYGLGSSGALCAAVYDRYRLSEEHEPVDRLKSIFSEMESHFHGKSSGIDPLVSYLNHPVKLSPDEISKIDLDEMGIANKLTLFLVNTNSTSSTGVLVEEFLQDLKGDSYARRIHQEYLPLTKRIINSFINHEAGFYKLAERISTFQLEYFRKMIPDNFIELWRHGLLTRKFALKLCGSGGGGFLLGFSMEAPGDIELLISRTFQEEVLFLHKFG